MQEAVALLADEASKRSGIPLTMLTDIAQGERPIPTAETVANGTYDPNAVTYHTLEGSVVSAIAYAAGERENGLRDVVEDCEDYEPMATFMRAVLEILVASPDMFSNYTLDPRRLTEIRHAI